MMDTEKTLIILSFLKKIPEPTFEEKWGWVREALEAISQLKEIEDK